MIEGQRAGAADVDQVQGKRATPNGIVGAGFEQFSGSAGHRQIEDGGAPGIQVLRTHPQICGGPGEV